VPSAPKALANVGSRPFLELLVEQLASQGIRNLVLCTGYLAEHIEQHFGDGRNFGVAIEYSRDPSALGTGGAVKFAQAYLQGIDDFFVMNGDSYLEISYHELLQQHHSYRAAATLAVVRVEDAGRYGTVRIDSDDRIVEFCEKTGDHSPGVINAGVYVFNSSVLRRIPAGQVSLEKDFFPKLLDDGVFAVRQRGVFIDIGTPADYSLAQQLLGGSSTPASGGQVRSSTVGQGKEIS